MQPWLASDSPCRPGWRRTHNDPPASVFYALELKAWATMGSLPYLKLTLITLQTI